MGITAAALLLAGAGCAEDPDACTQGSDCPSGACGTDGTCVPVSGSEPDFGSQEDTGLVMPDLSGPDGSPADQSDDAAPLDDSDDGGADRDDAVADGNAPADGEGAGDAGDGSLPADDTQDTADSQDPVDTGADSGNPGGLCTPNQDGTVTRAEIPLGPGLHATFLTSKDATVDTAGSAQPDGSRVWDYKAALAADSLDLVTTIDPAGQWWESAFPGASYAAELTSGSDLRGVFAAEDDALRMLAIVSPQGGMMRTELTYDPPVVVLDFPLSKGKSWSTTSVVTGLNTGVVVVPYTEKYAYEIDHTGLLHAPFASFKVLRVRTTLTQIVGVVPVSVIRSFLFVAECFGTVATARSKPNEPLVEFTVAGELRRLAP